MFGVTVRSQVGRSSQRACQPVCSSCSSRIPGSQSDAVSIPGPSSAAGGGETGSSAAGRTATLVISIALGTSRFSGYRPRRFERRARRATAVRHPGRGLGSPGDDGGRVLVEHPQPDVLDLVAQGRRPLELELLGRGLHLGFHLGHDALDLGLAPGRQLGRCPGGRSGPVDLGRLRDRPQATEVYRPGSAARAPAELAAWSKAQVERVVAQMEAEMKAAAKQLEFERAAALRDEIQNIRLRVLDEDASTIVARAAEAAARVPEGRRPAGEPSKRRGRYPEKREVPSAMEITSVAVLPAAEEPVSPPPASEEGPGIDTASDWLPGIRDEHDEQTGWQARWLDRPTWDRTVTPNIRHRTGARSGRRRSR